jgi:hypothetical protein
MPCHGSKLGCYDENLPLQAMDLEPAMALAQLADRKLPHPSGGASSEEVGRQAL